MTNIESFLIEHIDPLGQGVYKDGDNIFFIPKTLPGESGTLEILKKKKGVHFARVKELQKESPLRVKPECPHFDICSGCHFLHTDYQNELEFKTQSFHSMLERAKVQTQNPIQSLDSPKRLAYRNRVQLHYSLPAKKIGFLRAQSKSIISIPECKIMEPAVQEAFTQLITNDNWIKLAKKQKKKYGHVEIYNSPQGLKISWNKRYAHGGFTQVNQEVNEKINKSIISTFQQKDMKLLDLFAGGGNLSNQLQYEYRKCLDYFGDESKYDQSNKEFFNLNLFDENALKDFQKECSQEFDTFLIDPPRSGFKQLHEWVDAYNPKEIFYVSCHPATMIRDIKEIQDKYEVITPYLYDLFPSTFHFEGALHLKRKE